jgi:hypothetical protein
MRSDPPIAIYLIQCTDHVRITLPEATVALLPEEAWALGGKLRRMASGLIAQEASNDPR